MELENREINVEQEYWKKSWLAYLRLVIPAAIICLLSIPVVSVVTTSSIASSFFPSVVITVVYIILSILSIRSYKLFYDDDGIWVYSGIFPWSKGISGIKWRDLDEAVYRTGFISWAAHSYNIRLSHRYTKSSEILLNDIEKGDKAVMRINELHIEYLRKNEK